MPRHPLVFLCLVAGRGSILKIVGFWVAWKLAEVQPHNVNPTRNLLLRFGRWQRLSRHHVFCDPATRIILSFLFFRLSLSLSLSPPLSIYPSPFLSLSLFFFFLTSRRAFFCSLHPSRPFLLVVFSFCDGCVFRRLLALKKLGKGSLSSHPLFNVIPTFSFFLWIWVNCHDWRLGVFLPSLLSPYSFSVFSSLFLVSFAVCGSALHPTLDSRFLFSGGLPRVLSPPPHPQWARGRAFALSGLVPA